MKGIIFTPSYKDEKRSSWYCKFYYTDWTGIRKTKMKRGFKTKKEAASWELEFLEKQQGTPDMSFQAIYDLYMEDMEHRLKTSTMKPKRYLFMHHIVPLDSIDMVNNIYGHLYPNKHNEAANKLQELVSK